MRMTSSYIKIWCEAKHYDINLIRIEVFAFVIHLGMHKYIMRELVQLGFDIVLFIVITTRVVYVQLYYLCI